jgi:predicted DNA-binding transcriptional regulator YafY
MRTHKKAPDNDPFSHALVFRSDRLNRLRQIDALLRGTGMPHPDLMAKELGCGPRSVERDMQLLKERFGLDIIRDATGDKLYRYRKGTGATSPISLTEGDLIILQLGQKALEQYKGTPFSDSVREAYTKIVAHLFGGTESIDISHIKDAITFDPGPITDQYNPSVFKTILDALKFHNTVCINYFTASTISRSKRNIDPYHVTNIAGDWYVIGFDHQSKEIRTFHIGRIHDAALLGNTFTVPDNFDLQDYLDRGFSLVKGDKPTQVIIEFSAKAAPYIRNKIWKDGQKIQEMTGGGVKISFMTEGLEAVKRWVLGFGGEARVICPSDLSIIVKNEARSIIEQK